MRARAYAAYRAGDVAGARAMFQRLAEAGGDALAWSDLAVAEAALGAHDAARAHHEKALALRQAAGDAPGIAATLHNLGATHRALGAPDLARHCHERALDIWRGLFGPASPEAARAWTSLGALAAEAGRDGEAEACWRAALAAPATAARRAGLLNNLGVICRRQGRLAEAAALFEAAVAAEPGLAAAAHNLAACLSRLGLEDQARAAQQRALGRQNLFIDPAPDEHAPRVLILASASAGNVPLEHVLPPGAATRIWWFADYGPARLPRCDVVLNGMGDADMDGAAAPHVAAFLAGWRGRVLNPPDAVARTRRDRLPGALAGIAGLVVPPAHRAELPPASLAGLCAEAGYPCLLRPAGRHGGQGLRRLDSPAAALPETAPGAWYATPYVETRAADGFWRKYRLIFVDGVAYPYHLAISPHWMVHYATADMPGHAWKLAEEMRFLEDWRGAAGAAAAALAALPAATGLDYFGVDFTLLPDGRALIFEANATMLVHPEEAAGPLAHKNPAIGAILAAVRAMIRKPDPG